MKFPLRLLLAAGLAAAAVAGFTALGFWQLARLDWKLALIDRVEQRVHARPVAPPARAEWPRIDAAGYEYRRLLLQGRFLHDSETQVRAGTQAGFGWWVLTPLQLEDGSVVLVNRGYVPPERRDPATRLEGQPEGVQAVTGLLRLSEPGGTFMRSNKPQEGLWYSRDVAAIAAARGLADVAPYFVDAEAAPAAAPGQPQGGLTVLQFRNAHLGYALTWFSMAALLAGTTLYLLRQALRRTKRNDGCGEPLPTR
ncbi:MAG: SURF1 family protein [Steroidobacteraceae bacterium]